jgi:hypothetical protein
MQSKPYPSMWMFYVVGILLFLFLVVIVFMVYRPAAPAVIEPESVMIDSMSPNNSSCIPPQ